MALSDEEGEILPHHVLNYYFLDEKDGVVSFSILPVQWNENDELSEPESQVVLRGTSDDGIQKLYMPVIAWKFELSYAQPEISVLTKAKNWIVLQKPRKSFEARIKTILITVHWLHFIKRKPNASEETVWKHLLKCFSSYDGPKFRDLLDHRILIEEAARRDKDIEASNSFRSFVWNCGPGVTLFENDVQTGNSEISDEDEDMYDKVCAICDDGGNILSCNGRCLRSFHPTAVDGVESKCVSLGFRNKAEYEAIPVFWCDNCLSGKHQCYACGRLGSPSRISNQEVFPCSSATCGHFYHPECVARMLHADSETQAVLRDKIIAGESFVCPAHKCFSCDQHEVADVHELQFAICRRCPKSYHRKCLPRAIVFKHESTETNLQRAWECLLPNRRILIYCMDHKIDRYLKTPSRDHLIFPNVEGTQTSEPSPKQKKLLMSKRTKVSGGFTVDKTSLKKQKLEEKHHNGIGTGDSFKKEERCYTKDFEHLKKSNMVLPAKKALEVRSVSSSLSAADKTKFISTNYSLVNSAFYAPKSKRQYIANSKIKNYVPDKPAMKKKNIYLPLVDAEMENRITALMQDITSAFDVKEYKERNLPDMRFYSYKNTLEKSMTLGLVEGSVKAVRTALQRLEEGCNIEDAKVVCPPQVLRQICRWKKKLKVHLAPFFYGARYTSFGRHFTQVEKLNEIVGRLQWYVQGGDMIVDFCCGANDFSCLLKEKLAGIEKPCLFKNYDIIQAKNDFSFEKRDWMSVGLHELPDGSRLILGLNPPFGTNASLAYAFIKKALEFKPKLIVLIAPKQTERLDIKAPYDLIWEDDELLLGKSFYLPGSVDVDDKQMEDWNLSTPPLYLWSRADWTARHVAIAQEHGHLSTYM